MLHPGTHKPRKEFGQNFLIDESIISKIINFIQPQKHQEIIEIGPGLGAITHGLLSSCDKLIIVEIDNNLSNKLLQRFHQQVLEHKLYVINQDILTVDLLQLPLRSLNDINSKVKLVNGAVNAKTNLRIVGNLPYNISSPLLFKLFGYSEYLFDLNFLLQKEFAARLAAAPNSKQYGKLSVMAQYHAKIQLIFNVSSLSFYPKPQVESSMVNIVPYTNSPYVANNYDFFNELVTTAFSQRRKTLANCLKKYCTKLDLLSLNIDPGLRPEQLSVADFVNISNSLN